MPTIIMWPFKNNTWSWNYKVTRDLKQLQRQQQKQRQKTIGFMTKTTAPHVNHAF